MKTVFNNNELCHVWAQRNQDHGRGNSMFFEGNIIYSYGKHFTAGVIHNTKKGRITLINSCNYSNTTIKHLRSIRNAVNGLMPSFNVPNPLNLMAEENHLHLSNPLFELFDRTLSNRTKAYGEYLKSSIFAHLKELNEFEKLTNRLETKLDADFLEIILKIESIKDKNEVKKANEKNKFHLEIGPKVLQDWIEGVNAKPHHSYLATLKHDIIRVRGDQVETIRGAKVELRYALRLLKKIEQKEKVNGERIGYYTVDKLLSKGQIKIGCHVIDLKQAKQALEKAKPTLHLLKPETNEVIPF